METDPLADTVPPRYAIESDDEDEVNPLRLPSQEKLSDSTDVHVKIIGSSPKHPNLVVAIGDAGMYWAKGANLGEQTGEVIVNGIQIGMTFRPSWTTSIIIVSESLSKLPVWAMNHYTRAILDYLEPSSVSILDTYSTPIYATSAPMSAEFAPLRYLATSTVTISLGQRVKHFSPPNLIHSTSASFMSFLDLRQIKGILVLLPSPHIPRPYPRNLVHTNLSNLAQNDELYPLVDSAHELLFDAFNESPIKWQASSLQMQSKNSRGSEIGDSGMYI